MKKLLGAAVLVAGYLIMSLELLGSRILAPYFGNSIYVWGVLIGLILAALALGYYWGGLLAERLNGGKWFLRIFLAVTLFLLADIFFYRAFLERLDFLGAVWGAAVAVGLLFLFPMAALAAVAPLALALMARLSGVGRSAGLVYMLGTIGSLLGTFLTVFWLIPYFGSRLTLYSCFFIALLVSVCFFLAVDRRRIFFCVLIFFVSLFSLRPPILPSGVILEAESAYNQIRLVEKGGLIYFILNSRRAALAQSAYVKNGTIFNLSIIDLFSLGAEITSPKNILILGMSGGASIRQFQQYFPLAKIDAVEIDPKVAEIARANFGISENENLKIYIDDARPFLVKTAKKYDLVEVDLFQGGPHIPFYALTKEFFEAVGGALAESGVMVMNIYAPANKEILTPALNTIAAVFPSVFEVPLRDNVLALATKEKTSLEEMKDLIKKNQTHEDFQTVNQRALEGISLFRPAAKAPVFTDDWAPVEAITYHMVRGLKL